MNRREFLKASVVATSPVVVPALMVKPASAPVRLPETTLFPTGIRPLDEALGGGLPKGIVLVLGQPGSGKTAFLNRLAFFPYGNARHVQAEVIHQKEPTVCPITGINHWLPDHITYKTGNHPVDLLDDIQDIASCQTFLRQRLFLDFFFCTSCLNTVRPGVSVITWQTNRKAVWDQGTDHIGYYSKAPFHFTGYYSNTVIRLHNLDIRGRGRITVIKNHQTGFNGELMI